MERDIYQSYGGVKMEKTCRACRHWEGECMALDNPISDCIWEHRYVYWEPIQRGSVQPDEVLIEINEALNDLSEAVYESIKRLRDLVKVVSDYPTPWRDK